MSKHKSNPETLIMHDIIDWLNYQPWCLAKRVNPGARYDPKVKRWIKPKAQYSPPGIVDIDGVLAPDGKTLFIEVKTPKEYQYVIKHYDRIKTGIWDKKDKRRILQNQIIFMEERVKLGAIAFFSDSIQRTQNLLIAEGFGASRDSSQIDQ